MCVELSWNFFHFFLYPAGFWLAKFSPQDFGKHIRSKRNNCVQHSSLRNAKTVYLGCETWEKIGATILLLKTFLKSFIQKATNKIGREKSPFATASESKEGIRTKSQTTQTKRKGTDFQKIVKKIQKRKLFSQFCLRRRNQNLSKQIKKTSLRQRNTRPSKNQKPVPRIETINSM